MRVCHIMTSDPKAAGGVETLVKNIREHHDVKYLGVKGPLVFVKGLLLALSLAFSKYDLICSHDNAGYMYARLPKFMRTKKFLACYYGSTAYYYEILPPKTIYAKLTAVVYTHLQSYTLKKADRVITVSKFTSNQFKKRYNIDSFVAPLGVDTKRFRPSGAKKRYDYIWIGTNPGLRGLDRAIEYAKKRGKKLLVVGVDGSDTGLVTYAGKINNDTMPDIINSARSIIYFSEYEGCPLAVFEAMACGLDVICNKNRLDDIKFGKKGGVFFLPGKKARKIALARDWSATVALYNKIYGEMLANRSHVRI